MESQKFTAKNFIFLVLDFALNAVIIIGIVYVVRTYLISPFQVFGPSMCNTLNQYGDDCVRGYGEYIIINKINYRFSEPHRGDIIVFHPPGNKNDFYIKRIIGLGGDTVELKKGYVYISNKEHPKGVKLNEPYLSEDLQGETFPFEQSLTKFVVPEGHFFALGDNRKASTDSRSCFKDPFSGGCKKNKENAYLDPASIQGKAWVVLWPLKRIRLLPEVAYANGL